MNPSNDKVLMALATFLPTGTKIVRLTDIVFDGSWSDLQLTRRNIITTVEDGLTFILFVPPCDLPISWQYLAEQLLEWGMSVKSFKVKVIKPYELTDLEKEFVHAHFSELGSEKMLGWRELDDSSKSDIALLEDGRNEFSWGRTA